MAIIKCKMCGGDIELAADKTFGTCEFCGSTMTLPKVDDEQRAAAFNRGNHFRRIGEFDKALAVYERIVREDDTDAEAHWCCALCRFGIEYVEDPATYEYLPTCHRASFDSFLEDVDYLAAVEHSEGITKRQYQKDAAKIAEVQRGILATSQNEEPFDVFICYKESDENGERTRDSLMAQDVYYQLTDQGYRVFFARITLEDVVGKQYEPYIFAALNSAKVMIAIGTKPEYMNAVWVKNEWSRFLVMMKKDRQKLLLPCYRDMDPYDMPEQLSVLQSYDMSKIGFIQDLIRGIKKVLDMEKKPEPSMEAPSGQQIVNSNAVALLKRGNMALEDSEWDRADGFFEEVLNHDAECAGAYLGKLLAELRLHKAEDLAVSETAFKDKLNYQRAIRFSNPSEVDTLSRYLKQNIKFLLDSGYRCLEEGAWSKADRHFTEALKQDAECAGAYLGKLLAELQLHKAEDLAVSETAFKDKLNYQRAIRFSNPSEVDTLNRYLKQNIKFLLDSGYRCLEEGAWSKADRHFTEALKQDARCNARLGRFLGAYRVATLDAFVEQQIDDMQKNQVFQRLKAPLDYGVRIADITVPVFLCKEDIQKQLPLFTWIDSSVQYWEEQVEKIKNFVENDEQLADVRTNMDGEQRQQLDGTMTALCQRVEDLLAAARQKEAEDIRGDDTRRAQKEATLANIMKQWEKALVACEERYQDLCRKQESVRDVWSLQSLKHDFQQMLGYKDCAERARQVVEKINELERENQAQQARDREVAKWIAAGRCQYCGGELTGVFGKKCASCGKPKDY